MAEQLFNGELPVQDFMTNYKTKRMQAHMRRIKTEKMRELILDVQRNSTTTTTPTIPPRGSISTPPYPGSSRQMQSGAYQPQYQPQLQSPSYPSNAFSQPSAQQYPSYKWR